MMNFNAAAREVCTVQTETTNTPLQALTLMNNQTFVECARFFAERILNSEHDTIADSVAFAFRQATGRRASDVEIKILLDSHARFLAHFRDDHEAAKQLLDIGEKPRDDTLPIADHAAMTMTASLILNLDETISKE